MAEGEDRMRVAVVVSHLGFGGAERQTLDLLQQLRGTASAPVGVICLSANAGAHGDTVRALGYPLEVVPRAGGFDLGRVLALRRLLHEHAADVIHAVNWFASGYAVLAKPRGARVVSSIRNSHLPAGVLRRLALTRLVRRSDGVLVNSERGRDLVMAACRVPAARIALVRNGIDVDRLRSGAVLGSLRRELGIPDAAPLVLYVGRHARVKNIPRLLSVARLLFQANADVRIVLAGDGLDRSLVAGTPLAHEPRLACLGPRADIPSLLRDATVLALTSDSEGMPNVVLEALASGLPVVATDVGDLSRIVPHGCGVLVPPDAARLASAILQVMAGAAGYRRAAERQAATMALAYSSQAMARRTVDLWKAVAQRADERRVDLLDDPLRRIVGSRIE
jgi:glycosyltransferase involved in cell wall biosynthesis